MTPTSVFGRPAINWGENNAANVSEIQLADGDILEH